MKPKNKPITNSTMKPKNKPITNSTMKPTTNSTMKPKNKPAVMTETEYFETFCIDKRIRNRSSIYVSTRTHRRIQEVSYIFARRDISLSSLVDTILINHLEQHKDLLQQMIREDFERTFPSINSHK